MIADTPPYHETEGGERGGRWGRREYGSGYRGFWGGAGRAAPGVALPDVPKSAFGRRRLAKPGLWPQARLQTLMVRRRAAPSRTMWPDCDSSLLYKGLEGRATGANPKIPAVEIAPLAL